jgi:hypothetical protein
VKNNLRIWVIGSVAVMAALLLGGWFVGVQPFLAAASTASASADQVAASNQATQTRLAGLVRQSNHMDELKAEEQSVAAAVPSSLDANGFVDRINAIAADSKVHVVVQAVTPGTPQAYTPPASAEAAQQAAAAAAQPAATPAPTAAAVAAAAPAEPVLAATDPSITASNFTVVPMTVSVKGTMEGTLRFTHALQHDTRLFLVTNYALSTDGMSGGQVLATLNGYIYSLKQ